MSWYESACAVPSASAYRKQMTVYIHLRTAGHFSELQQVDSQKKHK